MNAEEFDLAVVGSGVLGLAHATLAHQAGQKVIVVERDAQANGASIRNFGFVTVTGQGRGATWRRARRSAQVWAELAPQAGIEIVHRGLLVQAQRPEAMPVLEAFAATEMGVGCSLLSAQETRQRYPSIRPAMLEGALWSPHELRVESRTAIPQLASWLAERGVRFVHHAPVRAVTPQGLDTARGPIRARHVVVCPGDDLNTLYPEMIAAQGVTRCKLQMLRLANPGFALPGSVMSDLSLVRYRGYAALPQSAGLRARLEAEQPAHLQWGVHLIVVQSADGSLVVGDSHVYGATPDPFAREDVDALILAEFEAMFGCCPKVLERWTGTYSSAPEDMFMAAPAPHVRLVMVTSGTGASTAFAIAEETLADLQARPTSEIA